MIFFLVWWKHILPLFVFTAVGFLLLYFYTSTNMIKLFYKYIKSLNWLFKFFIFFFLLLSHHTFLAHCLLKWIHHGKCMNQLKLQKLKILYYLNYFLLKILFYHAFLLIIDLYFLDSTAIAQSFNPITKNEVPKGYQVKKQKHRLKDIQ